MPLTAIARENQIVGVRQARERDSEAGETQPDRNEPGRRPPIRKQAEQGLSHRRKKRLREDQPGRGGIAQMICRDEKRQHRRHDTLVEVVGEVAAGKQSYRPVIGRLGLVRVGRYFGCGTHESLYLAEDRDRKQPPQKPRGALTVRTCGQLVLRMDR